MKKKFDSVSFQRKVRDAIGKEFSKNQKSFIKNLHEQFGHLHRIKSAIS